MVVDDEPAGVFDTLYRLEEEYGCGLVAAQGLDIVNGHDVTGDIAPNDEPALYGRIGIVAAGVAFAAAM